VCVCVCVCMCIYILGYTNYFLHYHKTLPFEGFLADTSVYINNSEVRHYMLFWLRGSTKERKPGALTINAGIPFSDVI